MSVRPLALVGVATFLLASSLFAQSPEALIAGWYALSPEEPGGKTPFAVQGWVLATCGPAEVRVAVDGRELWRGRPSFAWPGVAEKYPAVAGADRAGFWTEIDPTLFSPGEHRLEVAVVACGEERALGMTVIRTAPPTAPWIAWPLLLLLLAVVPAFGGLLVANLGTATREIPRLELGVALLLVALALTVVVAPRVGSSVLAIDDGAFAPLANWDGRYYLHLAREGYSEEFPETYAFFPLYPALLSVLAVLPLPLPLAASLANAGLFLLLVVLLRRLYPGDDAGVLVVACLPFAFFFVVVYSDALALVLAAGFLLALRRGRTGWAFVLGVAAGLARVSALPLALFALEPLRERRWQPALAAFAAPVAGLGAWMAWLGWTTGDPLKFLHVQAEFGRAATFHPGRLLDAMTTAAARGPSLRWWELFFLVLVLVGAAALVARRRWGEGAYAAAVVLMPLVTLRLTSLNRYALAAFPVYVLLGGLLHRRWAVRLVVAVELVLSISYAARFGLHYWVG